MYLASLVGGGEVAIPVALLIAWALWRRRRAGDARAYTIIALSGWALYGLAKFSIRRARPHVIPYLFTAPGGIRTRRATARWRPSSSGWVPCSGARRGNRKLRRLALIAGASLLAFTIAFSRVYIGVHYPSDVAGGLLLGMAWSSFWFWWWGTVGDESKG